MTLVFINTNSFLLIRFSAFTALKFLHGKNYRKILPCPRIRSRLPICTILHHFAPFPGLFCSPGLPEPQVCRPPPAASNRRRGLGRVFPGGECCTSRLSERRLRERSAGFQPACITHDRLNKPRIWRVQCCEGKKLGVRDCSCGGVR
jgi:hypothetical protein